MPRVVALLLCLSFAIACGAQSCPSSNAPGWSEQLRQLMPDCNNRIHSPDGQFVFQIGSKERMRLLRGGNLLSLIGNARLALPAVMSWSPISTDLFVNDGKGSGLYSQLRVFHISDSQVKESGEVNTVITRIYRNENRCDDLADNPNVYGIGWSADGQRLYAIAQATVNQPCGKPEEYLGFIVNTKTYLVERTLITAQAKSEFKSMLPSELR